MPYRDRDPRDYRDYRDSREARDYRDYRDYRDSREARDYRDYRDYREHDLEFRNSPHMPYWMRDENPRQGFGGMRPVPHQDHNDWRYDDESAYRSWDRHVDIYARGEGEAWRGRFFGRGPKGYRRSDERIREEICDRLTTHPDVDASEIDVRVANGIVTLIGLVDDRHQKRVAEYIAEDAIGVDDVQNELKVRHGFWATVTGERAVERQLHRDADIEVGSPSSIAARESSARSAARRDAESR